jgi:hypothetical protein
LVLRVVTAITPATMNRAVVNFFADMRCSRRELDQTVDS